MTNQYTDQTFTNPCIDTFVVMTFVEARTCPYCPEPAWAKFPHYAGIEGESGIPIAVAHVQCAVLNGIVTKNRVRHLLGVWARHG